MRFEYTDGCNPDFIQLCHELDDFLNKLVVAMALYKKIVYKVISNYGPYKDMPDSVCMKKKL